MTSPVTNEWFDKQKEGKDEEKMKKRVMGIAVVLAFGLLSSLAFAQETMKQDTMKQDKMKDSSMKKDSKKDSMQSGSMLSSSDQKFVMEAAHGGMMEVELGQMAVEKASNPEVKQFGQRMIDDHSKAGEELKQFASQKGIMMAGEDPKAMAKEQPVKDKLSKLSGADFDRAYMDLMVKDHTKDVKEFEEASMKSKDADLKAWAAKTLPTLREHLQMARDVNGKVATSKKMSSSK